MGIINIELIEENARDYHPGGAEEVEGEEQWMAAIEEWNEDCLELL